MATQIALPRSVPPQGQWGIRAPKRERRTLLYLLELTLLGIVVGPMTALTLGGRTPTLYWADIPAVITVWLAVITVLKSTRRQAAVPKELKWCWAYLIIAAISLAQGPDILFGLSDLKAHVMPALLLLAVWLGIRSEKSARHLMVALVLCGGLIALDTIYNFNLIRGGGLAGSTITTGENSKDWVQTSFGKSNYLASIFAALLPLAACLCIKTNLRSKILGLTSFGAMAAALTLTQARGAFAAIILGLLSLWVVNIRRTRLTVGRIVWAVVIVAAFSFVVYRVLEAVPRVAHDFEEQITHLENSEREGNYGGNRSDIWLFAARYIAANPIIGIGLGGVQENYQAMGLRVWTVHNLYLEVMLENGIIGFIPFMTFLTMIGVAWWKAMRAARSAYVKQVSVFGLLSYFIMAWNCAVEPSFWGLEYSYLMWTVMGLGLVMLRRGPQWGLAANGAVSPRLAATAAAWQQARLRNIHRVSDQ